MMEVVEVVEVRDRDLWEEFNLSFQPASFLQSWAGGEMHARLGKKIIRRGYRRRGRLAGIALLIKERARRGVHLLSPGGPVLDWNEARLARAVLEDVAGVGKREGAVFVRARPTALDKPETKDVFRGSGWRRAPMHLEAETTWELGLDASEETLLAGMRKGTRLAIRKTREAGVVVKPSKDPAEADLLYQLQKEAAGRHHFVPFSRAYFRAHAEAFLPRDLLFFKAFWQNRPWAVAMVVYYGDTAVYHYAASKASPRGLSPPSLILWEAIREAKRRRCRIFNFWGVAPTDKPRHRFHGVTRFKQGFGGKRRFYLPAQDYPLKFHYWPVRAFETLRRLKRGL
jgi:lipid II:glycine glycyltransferase (peptidoglycan interpeptide bridge formation enzyme)